MADNADGRVPANWERQDWLAEQHERDAAAEPADGTLRFGKAGPFEAKCAHCRRVVYLCVLDPDGIALPSDQRDWRHKKNDALLCDKTTSGRPGV